MLGRYGRMHETSLRENQPARYAAHKRAGTLLAHLESMDQQATQTFDGLFAALLKQHPAPTSYLARVQHLETLRSQAEEVVMQDVLVKDPETGAAERDGYLDDVTISGQDLN